MSKTGPKIKAANQATRSESLPPRHLEAGIPLEDFQPFDLGNRAQDGTHAVLVRLHLRAELEARVADSEEACMRAIGVRDTIEREIAAVPPSSFADAVAAIAFVRRLLCHRWDIEDVPTVEGDPDTDELDRHQRLIRSELSRAIAVFERSAR